MRRDQLPVLIAGGGSVGLSLALFLAHHGVRATVLERMDGPSIHPRATGLGPRTVEFLRELGLQDALDAAAVDMTGAGLGKIAAETLATADLSSLPVRMEPRGGTGQDAFSPGALRGLCPQHRLDALLLAAARERGADVRYATRLTGLSQDAHGVTATVHTAAGARTLHADYLVAADGARSDVRTALGIGVSGPGGLGTPMINILFCADLLPYTGGVPFVNCNISTPDAPGMIVTVDGRHDWIFHSGFDADGGERAEDFPPERCRALIRAAVGDPDLAVEVRSVLPWRPRGTIADSFAEGRVFLAGDAARTVPPVGAFGLNTGIADAHNLAWKLAAVLHGDAAPALLDTYAAERRPVAELVLDQALRRLADPSLHWARGPEADAARRAAGVLDAPVVHLGYRYDSAAVIDPDPVLPSTTDVTLDLDGTPGSRVPHLWLGDGDARVSTVDLVRGWTLLSAEPGWLPAAREVGLTAHHVTDPRWPRATGTGATGALLVRPDAIVGWRTGELLAAPAAALTGVLQRLLHRASAAAPVRQ